MKKTILFLILLVFIIGCTQKQGAKAPPQTQPEGQKEAKPEIQQQTPPEKEEIKQEEKPIPEPPTGTVSIYKGFWMPCAFLSDECQPMSDINLQKEVGSNIVLLGLNLKINSNGDVKFDVPMDYIEQRMNTLAERYYREGIRIGLVIETLFVNDFSETTPAGGPGAFPASAVNKPGFLENYNKVVEEIAKLAEKYHVDMFSPMNEPDLKLGEEACSKWGQEVLPLVKKHYNGKVLYKTAFYKLSDKGVDFKGYDIIGMDPSPGGDPNALSDYPKDMEQMLNKALGFAKRDNVKYVMYTEFGVWGGALRLSEDDKALAHRIIFETGKGKAKGFIALDPPPDLDRSIKRTKTFEEIKAWFMEKLE